MVGKKVSEIHESLQEKLHYMNSEYWKNKTEVVFVDVLKEGAVSVVSSTGGSVEVFSECIVY